MNSVYYLAGGMQVIAFNSKYYLFVMDEQDDLNVALWNYQSADALNYVAYYGGMQAARIPQWWTYG